jgi:hypothetical protein
MVSRKHSFYVVSLTILYFLNKTLLIAAQISFEPITLPITTDPIALLLLGLSGGVWLLSNWPYFRLSWRVHRREHALEEFIDDPDEHGERQPQIKRHLIQSSLMVVLGVLALLAPLIITLF